MLNIKYLMKSLVRMFDEIIEKIVHLAQVISKYRQVVLTQACAELSKSHRIPQLICRRWQQR